MPSLATDIGGLLLQNPIVVASSPASETVGRILDCAQEGAGGIIVKSMSSRVERGASLGRRRVFVDGRGLWATSTYSRETLDASRGIDLIEKVTAKSSVPLIASIAATDLEPDTWVPLCQTAQQAGAKAIQLDLFYLPQPICLEGKGQNLRQLTKAITDAITIPVFPKLNIEIPAYYAAHLFDQTGIQGFSVLDSIRVPGPLPTLPRDHLRYGHASIRGMSSLFGSWQLPLTQHYTFILRRHGSLPICAGGGAITLEDTLCLLMIGASAVQFATALINSGPRFITSQLYELEKYLHQHSLRSINDICNSVSDALRTDMEESIPEYDSEAKAYVHDEKCESCGKCSETLFCDALTSVNGRVVVNEVLCEGCGFCAGNCPNNAIEIINKSDSVSGGAATIH